MSVDGLARRSALPTILLAALAAAVLFSNLGEPLGLHQNDEDYYAGIARTMLVSGDWLVPAYMGDAAFEKPPLLYWLMAASMRLFGPSLLAARLPTALCGVALVLLTAALARRYAPLSAAWLGGAVVATSFGLFQYGRAAMMDVPLALAVMISAAGFRESARGRSAGPYVAAAGMALGTLLKGPVAAVIATAAGTALWLATVRARRGAPGAPVVHWLGAALLGAAIAGAWPLALCWRGLGPVWFARFIVAEHAVKFQGPADSVAGMLGGFGALLAPWTLLLVGAFWCVVRERAWRDPDVMLPLAFIGANLAVFSVPAVKWSQYLLPSLPMLGLIAAWAARDRAMRPLKVAGTLTAGALLTAVVILLLAFRLLPVFADRALILLAAASLLAAAWGFLGARCLSRAAAAIGCGLVALAFLAPRLTLDRPPADLASLTAGHELLTFGEPPHRYANALGRLVGVHGRPQDIREPFERGAMIIIGAGDREDLARTGAVEPQRVREVSCWSRWRRMLTAGDLLRAVHDADRGVLTERVCVVQRR